MGTFEDLRGRKYGRLTVVKRAENILHNDGRERVAWWCACDCGKICVVAALSLKSGGTKSCGCLKAETNKAKWTKHNGCKDRLYRLWNDIKKRCYNPKYKQFKDYGGRGIQMCDEWRHDYLAFKKFALENGYDADAKLGECTIDRIDVDGNYSPENCRFVDMKVQNLNKRVYGRLLTYNGKTQNIAAWSKETGIHPATIRQRIEHGWSIEKALTSKSTR